MELQKKVQRRLKEIVVFVKPFMDISQKLITEGRVEVAYPIWPEVPVMYSDCKTIEHKLKHRIRRAVEKQEDSGWACDMASSCLVIWSKLRDCSEFFDLSNSDVKCSCDCHTQQGRHTGICEHCNDNPICCRKHMDMGYDDHGFCAGNIHASE